MNVKIQQNYKYWLLTELKKVGKIKLRIKY